MVRLIQAFCLAIITGIAGTVLYFNEPQFGAELTPQQLANLQTFIENNKQPNGKYRFFPKGELREDIEVHEYQMPDGQIGYQIIQTEDRADGTWRRSIATGAEAMERTYDWTNISPYVASSTP